MKMFTGLLSPTSGNAKLLEKVKTILLQMREKVGYMTQAFSLYNELSVFWKFRITCKTFSYKRR